MSFSKTELIDLYRKRAPNYDITANLYYLLGYREYAHRKKTVAALNLNPGDTVVEIGCGTGLNFPLIQKYVGAAGKIVGVDLTVDMLQKAEERVKRHGWKNVTLVQSDASRFNYPAKTNGILSTFAITLIPEYDEIIKKGSEALSPNGRFAILDFKKPEWPDWLIRFFLFISQPFGVTLDLSNRHPWESIEKYLTAVCFERLYFGLTYLSVGELKRS